MQTESIRILTVDEQPLVREGLATIFNAQADLAVVGSAAGGYDAMSAVRRHRPDVVTLDLQLPDLAGDDVVKHIRADFPATRIVAITSVSMVAILRRALGAGLHGYVNKAAPTSAFVEAIRQVHSGRRVIPAALAERIAENIADERLTPREVQVLRLVARGKRNKEVAADLAIADETVRMHMKSILGKLAANCRTHAVTIAVTRGVFQLEACPC